LVPTSDLTALSDPLARPSEVLLTRRELLDPVSGVSWALFRPTQILTLSCHTPEFTTDGAIGGNAQIAGEQLSGGESLSPARIYDTLDANDHLFVISSRRICYLEPSGIGGQPSRPIAHRVEWELAISTIGFEKIK
jgi:hypothetical protein